jgi:hypothetical protein
MCAICEVQGIEWLTCSVCDNPNWIYHVGQDPDLIGGVEWHGEGTPKVCGVCDPRGWVHVDAADCGCRVECFCELRQTREPFADYNERVQVYAEWESRGETS